MRAGIKFSIWAPSPSAEELRNRSPSPDREVKKKSEKSKKHGKGPQTVYPSPIRCVAMVCSIIRD